MPRWIQTLFGLREDQLIRNGYLSFWMSLGGVVLFLSAAVGVYYMVNVRLNAGVGDHVSYLREEARALSVDVASRQQLSSSFRVAADLLESSMSALSVVWIIIASLVIFCAYAAAASLRMRDLALEIQALKNRPGAWADGVCNKEGQS
ncbi:hypothetical protein [Brevifollis gellanilyticus]|uniref:Uncharacterized protein n=1 Tax=Brevifollis gellanilyticus TaxID=748831 RepID=A0A512M6A0_9BACT|nr:hypothetical protein [Brevifollis gellanilyticus]GEP42252.1 hypothetical protein BGE01nite_15430 [Brevifollis gellanilyticus]